MAALSRKWKTAESSSSPSHRVAIVEPTSRRPTHESIMSERIYIDNAATHQPVSHETRTSRFRAMANENHTTCGAWHHFSSSTMLSEGARPCPARAAPAAPALCLSVHGFCWLRRISPLMVLRLLERGGGGAVAAARCEREVYRLTRSPAPSRRRKISRAARGGLKGGSARIPRGRYQTSDVSRGVKKGQ